MGGLEAVVAAEHPPVAGVEQARLVPVNEGPHYDDVPQLVGGPHPVKPACGKKKQSNRPAKKKTIKPACEKKNSQTGLRKKKQSNRPAKKKNSQTGLRKKKTAII